MFVRDDPNATYKLLKPEFEKRGYSTTEESDGDHRYFLFHSPAGKIWRSRVARIGYPFTSLAAKNMFNHKEDAYTFAQSHGVNIPFTRYVAADEEVSQSEAQSLLDKYGTLIVKPSNSTLSRGLTLNITSIEALGDAITYARQIKKGVLIQEQIDGEEIRFIVLKGKVKGALLRQTARVIGDGHSTIAELIKAENEVRKTLIFPLISYPQLSNLIVDSSFFTDETILAEGEVRELNRATMIKNGSSVYNVLKNVHPSYIEIVENMVADVDTKFMAVDLFLKDYTQPKNNRNYWFIEFNTSPVLKLCYGCRDGKMFDIVPLLVEVIDEHLHQADNPA